MTPSKDSLSWQDWAESQAVTPSTQARRKRLLRQWAEASGKDSPQAMLDDIFLEKASSYSTANKFLNWLREQNMAPGTIALYRSMLGGEGDAKSGAGFFLSVLGEENFSVRKFNQLVPAGDNYTIIGKKAPTVDELRHILRNLANPRERALLGMLSVTGMRIEECLSRKMAEMERRRDGHVRIRLQAGATKKRYIRYVYLTKEVVDWIDSFHDDLPHSVKSVNGKVSGTDTKWIFPGERGEHLDRVSAYQELKDLFQRAGLNDTEDEIYSPHSMRKFAENQMVRCGFGDKFVRLTTGHSGQTERAYGDWDTVEAEWVEKCSEKMTWLTEKVEIVQVPDPRQAKEIETLKGQVAGMTEWFTGLHQFLEKAGVVIEKTPDGKLQFLPRKAIPQFYPEWNGKDPILPVELVDEAKEVKKMKAKGQLPELPDNSEVTGTDKRVESGA